MLLVVDTLLASQVSALQIAYRVHRPLDSRSYSDESALESSMSKIGEHYPFLFDI